jgi:glycosyltransferase involved in cell wall biosynthesis
MTIILNRQEFEMAEKIPSVTVIVPTFNRAEVLKFTLQTVLLQDFPDFEVWIVGDGCTDDSESVVASFGDGRFKWMNLPVNTGSPSIPRNEAVQRARGRYIAYLGHDDLWFPWHLSHLVRHLETTDAEFVCSLGALVKPEEVADVFSLPEKSRNPNWTVSPSNWLHRIELANRIGGWPSKKIWANDMLFLQKIWKKKAKISLTHSLSVLKFTASAWGMYGLESNYPQEKYVEAIANDPETLRLDLLQDIASNVAHMGNGISKKEWHIRELFRKTIMSSFNLYGLHRWPVNQLMRRRWRKGSGLT